MFDDWVWVQVILAFGFLTVFTTTFFNLSKEMKLSEFIFSNIMAALLLLLPIGFIKYTVNIDRAIENALNRCGLENIEIVDINQGSIKYVYRLGTYEAPVYITSQEVIIPIEMIGKMCRGKV
jgi:hypothetical protein